MKLCWREGPEGPDIFEKSLKLPLVTVAVGEESPISSTTSIGMDKSFLESFERRLEEDALRGDCPGEPCDPAADRALLEPSLSMSSSASSASS
mmetsp:Transcript_34538/g.82857  ORF Transcript_34538/g.82857 Transcript_34538/m.82857 type:complete len:93 (-) Transcript_34538:924-1202(-)